MAITRIPLGAATQDYDSKKMNCPLINMRLEVNNDGSFKKVTREPGLTTLIEVGDGPIRSDILVNSGFAYVVSGSNLYRFDAGLNVSDLGFIGGLGRAKLVPNSFPGDNEILIINGQGVGYTYNNTNGLVLISDPDFYPTSSITFLNEQFWAARDGTNEFFGSAVSDGQTWPVSALGVAQEAPDNVVSVVAKKSALWVLGDTTIEYYQSFTNAANPEFPLRVVKGASFQRGIAAVDSLAEIEDAFAFLADDGTVRMVIGNTMKKISDLDLETRIRGNGTARRPGTTGLSNAFGFWVDETIHKTYYLTIPALGITWAYDLSTGRAHYRESWESDRWRANSSGSFLGRSLVGDYESGKIYTIDEAAYDEDGEILEAVVGMPSISYETNVTIPLIEVDMEVGVGLNDGQGSDPRMMVEYSKDGGYTYTNWGDISIGEIGDFRKRVPIRRFGQLVRHKDFNVVYRVTDPVDVTFYGHFADIRR